MSEETMQKHLNEMVEEDYPDHVFKTVLTRSANWKIMVISF